MDNFINVTIPFQVLERTGDSVELTKKDRELLKEMDNNPKITISELTKILKIGKSTIGDRILKLKEKGVIERVGSNKSGSWKVLK